MKAIIEGMILEVIQKPKDNEIINIARLFQPGEKVNIDVKQVPENYLKKQGQKIKCLVSIFPYSMKGGASAAFACTYLEDA